MRMHVHVCVCECVRMSLEITLTDARKPDTRVYDGVQSKPSAHGAKENIIVRVHNKHAHTYRRASQNRRRLAL